MNDPRRAHLAALLDRFEPFDAEERGYLERMQRLLQVPGDPFHRDHFDPGHFTASAFILSPDRASLLLIFHGKLSRWLQPGGHVDPDDPTVVDAARREVHEEVGLDGVPLERPGIFDVDIHEIPARKADPAHYHYDVRFLLRAETLDFVAASDAKDGRWVPLKEISEELSDRSVMRAVEKLIGA